MDLSTRCVILENFLHCLSVNLSDILQTGVFAYRQTFSFHRA